MCRTGQLLAEQAAVGSADVVEFAVELIIKTINSQTPLLSFEVQIGNNLGGFMEHQISKLTRCNSHHFTLHSL